MPYRKIARKKEWEEDVAFCDKCGIEINITWGCNCCGGIWCDSCKKDVLVSKCRDSEDPELSSHSYCKECLNIFGVESAIDELNAADDKCDTLREAMFDIFRKVKEAKKSDSSE